VIGVTDYLTGHEIGLSLFYLAPVALAVWFVGPSFGVVISVLSTAISLIADLAAGAHLSYVILPWNAASILVFYLGAVWLLTKLRSLRQELEERVQQRTAALAVEVAERTRLSNEICEVCERERRAIGRDLHDNLGQHLAATALAVQVLGEKLASKDLDGTGMSNLQKYQAGFSPTNPAAYLHVISLARGGTDINVTYLGASGDTTYPPGVLSRTNVLEYSSSTNGNYTNGPWRQVPGQTNILGAGLGSNGGTGLGTVTNMTDVGGATNHPSRYYRVRVLLP